MSNVVLETKSLTRRFAAFTVSGKRDQFSLLDIPASV
jgi:hypothetical protein